MKLVQETLNELQRFERGLNPKQSIDIGKASLVKDIDSDNLELMLVGYNGKTHSRESFINYGRYRLDLEDIEGTEELYQRSKKYWDLLKDHIQIPEGIIWEYDGGNEVVEYVAKQMKKDPRKKFAYDCNPGGNYIKILFSDIELPSATSYEELIVDM